jgi:putative colanic acid biosynthesis glycosyltransferase
VFSVPDSPLITVIVVCRNPGARLHAALASIWSQQPAPPELVVVDGASTDGTREWLESQRARIATLITEPDRGVYDAMNKGLAAARGDWILFLGADDLLAGDRVLAEAAHWLGKTSAGVAAGEAVYADGRVYALPVKPRVRARNFVHHQAAFYRRSLFAENGGFDASLAIMGDYDLNLRLWRNRVAFRPLPLRIATCGPGGLSDAGRWPGYAEEITVRHRHFPAWKCWAWDAGSVLRWLRKKFLVR